MLTRGSPLPDFLIAAVNGAGCMPNLVTRRYQVSSPALGPPRRFIRPGRFSGNYDVVWTTIVLPGV